MSRKASDALTGELFSNIPAPAPLVPETMDYRPDVARMVAGMLDDARAKGLDRWEVAARMSRYAGHDTSKALLDSYTAASREECNLPLWKAPLIELACDARDLANWHAELLGGRVLWGREVMDAEIGRAQRELDELNQRVKSMRELQRRLR